MPVQRSQCWPTETATSRQSESLTLQSPFYQPHPLRHPTLVLRYTGHNITRELCTSLFHLKLVDFLLLSLRLVFRLYRLFLIYGPILPFNHQKMNIKIDNIINISAVILTLPFFFASLATLVKRRRMQFFFHVVRSFCLSVVSPPTPLTCTFVCGYGAASCVISILLIFTPPFKNTITIRTRTLS